MCIKNKFKLIPATLILLLASCHTTPTQEKNAPIENSPPILTPYESEDKKELISTPDEDVWDVREIDISEVDKNRKLISFTFDDAPSRTLENIFAVFANFNENNPHCKASATVFFNSALFDSQTPHLLYNACALGFELANHTHSHFDLTTLDREKLLHEIDTTDKQLERIDGQSRHLLRAPFGRTNALVQECASVPIIDWTIDTLDWTGASEEDIYNTVYNNRFSGAIVLMHDGYEHTVSALKRLLPDLEADGYQAVSLSKMIKAHGCNFRQGKVYIRARKQT